MEGAVAGVLGSVMSKKAKANTDDELIDEIKTVKLRLDTAASHFESESDPDLVEANIYEMKSLSARYRYLMREARREGVTSSIVKALEHTEHF